LALDALPLGEGMTVGDRKALVELALRRHLLTLVEESAAEGERFALLDYAIQAARDEHVVLSTPYILLEDLVEHLTLDGCQGWVPPLATAYPFTCSQARHRPTTVPLKPRHSPATAPVTQRYRPDTQLRGRIHSCSTPRHVPPNISPPQPQQQPTNPHFAVTMRVCIPLHTHTHVQQASTLEMDKQTSN